MSAYDLLIRGGEAVLPGIGHAPCDIAIREGRIAAILEPQLRPRRRRVSTRPASS